MTTTLPEKVWEKPRRRESQKRSSRDLGEMAFESVFCAERLEGVFEKQGHFADLRMRWGRPGEHRKSLKGVMGFEN